MVGVTPMERKREVERLARICGAYTRMSPDRLRVYLLAMLLRSDNG